MEGGIVIVFTEDGQGSSFAGTVEHFIRDPKHGEIIVKAKKVTTYATLQLALLNAGVNNAYVNLMNMAADASLEADWHKNEYRKAREREEMMEYDIAILKRKIEILQRQIQGMVAAKGQTP